MATMNSEAQAAIQRWTKEVRGVEVEPARRLMLAVLQDAVLTILESPPTPHGTAQRMVIEADSWLYSNNRVHPFSFLSICEALDLDAGYLRNAVDEWRGEAPRRRSSG